MIEKWRIYPNIGGHVGVSLTDFCEALDYTDHEILIAKLHVYDFDTDVLKFIYSYLRGEKD